MKPTQENILRLIQENKPKKELLSKKKVKKLELSAISDLTSLVKQFSSKIVPAYEKTKKEHSDWIEQGGKLKSRAANEYKLYNKNEEERTKLNIKIRKQAKELGIDVYDIPEFKKADNEYDSYSRIYKTYDFLEKLKL